jgi:hypothetical protein
MTNNNIIEELERVKEELLEKAKHIDITINTLKTMSFNSDNKLNEKMINEKQLINKVEGYEDFDSTMSFRNKVMFIIKKENRFVHSREISEILKKIEPTDEDLTRKVSVALSYFRQKNAISKIKIGNSNINTFWGSDKWLDENKNPKKEHTYNEKYLLKSSNDNILEL